MKIKKSYFLQNKSNAALLQMSSRWMMILLSFSIMFLVGCKKVEDHPLPIPNPIPSEEIQSTLVSVVDSSFYVPEQLVDAISADPATATWLGWFSGLNNMVLPMLRTVVNSRIPKIDSLFKSRIGLASDGSRQWQVESYVFHYRSVAASGEPVILSARVTLPNNTLSDVPHQLSTFSFNSHQYEMFCTWTPSLSLNLMDARAMYNSAVISPDYQGMGVDLLVHPVAASVFSIQGRQMADCISAAIDLLKSRGVSLAEDGHSTNWGSSLGSPAALSFLRYYEEHTSKSFRDAVRLSSSFICEGPLDVNYNLKFANENQNLDCCIYLYLAWLSSLTPEQLHGYRCADFLPSWMESDLATFNGENVCFTQIIASSLPVQYQKGDYKFESFPLQFNPDMLVGDSLNFDSPKVKALMDVYSEYSSFKDFHPSLPLYIGHCQADEHIPYVHARYVYEMLRQLPNGSVSNNVRWLEIPDPGSFVSESWGGTHYAISMLSLLYMLCSPEPADMAKFYSLE